MPFPWVLIRDPQGRFATRALLCTDQDAAPKPILSRVVPRWQLEVTFEEARRHLGPETRRQWSGLAIRRTTPALLGLFSLVTPAAQVACCTSASRPDAANVPRRWPLRRRRARLLAKRE